MKEVIEESIRLMQKGEPCVLATVVRTRGMTPQKAGAKQLIREDGSSVGTLGGGCMEGDIWFYAREMLRNKSAPELREYHLDADVAEKDGLVCGGTMDFFIEPFWQSATTLLFFEAIRQAYEGGAPLAVATVVKSVGQGCAAGTKMLMCDDGRTEGSLGPPELDKLVARVGKKLAPFGHNEMLQADDGTQVYVEGFTTPPTLIIMGGGHIGKSVYNLALMLGFRVIIVDDRPEFSNKERFPHAHQTVVADFPQALDHVPENYNSFILVATRGHRYDDDATHAALQTKARYIGLLGSRHKNVMIFRDLLESGVPINKIKEIHAPVGLDIGAQTPEELAVSIMAEIVQCIRGGAGGSLKMDDDEFLELMKKSE